MKPLSVVAILAVWAAVLPASSAPLSTGFTYQGELNENGDPLNGTADFQFSLWDALNSGTQSGSTLNVGNVTVTDGIFATFLDFGVDVFNGDNRWLEISVRSPAGGGAYTTLAPRVQVSATPYALQTRGIFVDSQGGVLVGDGVGTEPSRPAGAFVQFEANTASSNAIGILGEATAATGAADGVTGRSASSSGRGVVGEATAVTGATVGVHGTSVAGEGVRGEGTTGVCGNSDDTSGKGVFGEATGAGSPIGVHGKADVGEGVRGEGTTGVCGDSNANDGKGVFGQATGTGSTIGVHGSAADGEGVRGDGTTGVCGVSTGTTDGVGVYGESSGGGLTNRGVHGKSDAGNGEGVCGEAANGIGVRGSGDVGGYMTGEVVGLEGVALTTTLKGVGVNGECTSDDREATGVRAQGGGAPGPGVVYAAALTIDDGALRVDGPTRPAGTETVSGSASGTIVDSGGDTIARHLDVTINNDLITGNDDIILVTFEDTGSGTNTYSASVKSQVPGQFAVRVLKYGGVGGSGVQGKIHYLVIHPGENL